MTDWSKYVLPVGGLILLYYVLKTWGVIDTCNPECSSCIKGQVYHQLIGSCETNYSPCGLFHQNCCCDCCISLNGLNGSTLGELEGKIGYLAYLKYLDMWVDSL